MLRSDANHVSPVNPVLLPSTDEVTTEGPNGPAPRLRRHLSVFGRMGKATVNPFVSDSWSMPIYERLRLALLGVTLAPLRLAGVLGLLLVLHLICRITMWGVSRDTVQSAPLGGWRRWVSLFVLRPLVSFCFCLCLSCSLTRSHIHAPSLVVHFLRSFRLSFILLFVFLLFTMPIPV
jgi:hypothetical protein